MSTKSLKTTRQHRPLKRLSNDQLDELGESVRAEKKLRREDAGRFQADSNDRHYRSTSGGQYSRHAQLVIMRRNVKVWRP